jgi:hypothetical protein
MSFQYKNYSANPIKILQSERWKLAIIIKHLSLQFFYPCCSLEGRVKIAENKAIPHLTSVKKNLELSFIEIFNPSTFG